MFGCVSSCSALMPPDQNIVNSNVPPSSELSTGEI